MKRILLLFLFAAVSSYGVRLSAQSPNDKYGPNSAECLKYISYYEEYYKQKNYDEALPNWRLAYELCPVTSRYKILQDGTNLMRYLIKKNELNPAYKEKLVDSLMVIYQKRREFWPKYKKSSLNYYATDMYNYMQDKPEQLYKGLSEVVTELKVGTDMKTFPLYMKVACDLYKNDKLDPERIARLYNKQNLTGRANEIFRKGIAERNGMPSTIIENEPTSTVRADKELDEPDQKELEFEEEMRMPLEFGKDAFKESEPVEMTYETKVDNKTVSNTVIHDDGHEEVDFSKFEPKI